MSAASAAANRANAQLSTGPVTEAGKQRSSQNSLNHGLTSQKVVLPGESQEDFDALQAGFLKSYAPAGEVEQAMVRNLAASAWRLERMQRVETALFANRMGAIEKASGIAGVDALAAMFVDPAEMNRIRLFLRYMSETQRAYNKALRDIAVEQKARQQRNQKSPAQVWLGRAGSVNKEEASNPAAAEMGSFRAGGPPVSPEGMSCVTFASTRSFEAASEDEFESEEAA